MYLNDHPKIKRVNKASDVPQGPHYCVLIYSIKSVHHEGDERSRTNPGHGYPAYTEDISTIEQYVTTDQEAWESFVKYVYKEDKGENKFIAFEVSRVGKIVVNISLTIK